LKTATYEFGPFRLDPAEGTLRCGDDLVPVTPKALDLLRVLVKARGQVCSKEDLLAAVWPDTFVEESNLTFHVAALRKALEGAANGEARGYIETLPRRGYRFATPVTVVEPDVESAAPPAPPKRRRWWLAPVVLLMTAAAAVVALVRLPPSHVRSVAILRFASLDNSPASDLLGLGLADEITRKLGGLAGAIVRPTASVLAIPAGLDPLAAGRKLQVDAVLAGTIQQSQGRIRVNARLLDVADGRQIWAGQVERDASDVFGVEDFVSEQIVGGLQLRLSPLERQRFAKRYITSPQAYDLYLKGQYHLYRWSGEGAITAAEHFEQVIRLDPNYALAYVALAHALGVASHFGVIDPATSHARARPALDKAVLLDDGLAEAHLSRGMDALSYDWDGATAEREMEQALHLSPTLADAHNLHAALLCALGRADLAERQKAADLEPSSAFFTVGVGWAHFYARRYEEANRKYREAMAKAPGSPAAYWSLGESLEQQKRADEAIAAFQKSVELDNRSPRALSGLGHAYGLAGRKQEALQIADELQAAGAHRYVPAYFIAAVYMGMNDRDRAFNWLEHALGERSDWLIWLRVHPYLDGLRGDPRYASLEARVGLWNAEARYNEISPKQ
jgi:DNA-binding winged helix-turn-helix (wHTH) protein/TolB-like protein/Tfp pilus assembly protein PilF